MLVLARKQNEAVIVGGNVRVTVLEIKNKHVRLGFVAPDSVTILREELVSLEELSSANDAALETELIDHE